MCVTCTADANRSSSSSSWCLMSMFSNKGGGSMESAMFTSLRLHLHSTDVFMRYSVNRWLSALSLIKWLAVYRSLRRWRRWRLTAPTTTTSTFDNLMPHSWPPTNFVQGARNLPTVTVTDHIGYNFFTYKELILNQVVVQYMKVVWVA